MITHSWSKAIYTMLLVLGSSLLSAQSNTPIDSGKQLPQFVGGDVALHRYLADSLQYPKLAIDNCIKGTVFVKFKVTAEGEVVNPDVVMYAHPLLNREALRLIKSMPKWTLGDDSRIMTIPIVFELDCEPICVSEFVTDSLLNVDDFGKIDDSQHPNKALLEGQWYYKSFDIEVISGNKKEAKRIKKRFEEAKKKGGKELYEDMTKMNLCFHEDNMVDIYIGQGEMTTGTYRLRDDKLLVYSIIGGIQSIAYEVKNGILKMEVPIKSPGFQGKCVAKLVFKR